MLAKKMKRVFVVLLAMCTLLTQGNMLAFAMEYESTAIQSDVQAQHEEITAELDMDNKCDAKVESKFVPAQNKAGVLSNARIQVLEHDSYATVLTNTVSELKQAILSGANAGDREASVTLTFETRDSYKKMFDYLTSYLWYGTDWEPELGLLEMALYNEAELRPYMEYGSAENHFVEASQDEEALELTIYWPIFYNQPVENHISVTRSDGKVVKQEFVVLEDALEAMDKWNELYGSDVDYTVECLDLYLSLIAPDRRELPEANNIYFIGTEVCEEIAEDFYTGVQYSLFVASDLKANGNISISMMNIATGTISSVEDLFTWDLGGNTLSNYGFTDFNSNIVNGDLFLSKDNSDSINEEQSRIFRVFGRVDIGAVRVDTGYLELDGCYNSKIENLDNAGFVYVYGGDGSTLEIGTKRNTDVSVYSRIALTIGNIIETYNSYATLTVGMPEKGFYPTITGTVTDGNGNSIPLKLEFDDNFYTCAYDETYYYNINLDKDWTLLDAPNVDKVYFALDHTVYDENLRGRSVAIEGVLSKNTTGQFYLKAPMSWRGMEQTQQLELGKEYEASIKIYEDNVLVDDSKVTTDFYAYSDAREYFKIEQAGNDYTYSCDTFGLHTDLGLELQIDQEEGVTSWRFPIYVYAQEEVDSITIPTDKLTHIEGVGDVYLMVMNGLIYNVAHEGITPNVVSDAEYFLRYESCDENILVADYITGDLYAYGHGLCDIVAWSGNKRVTYTVLVGERTNYTLMYLNGIDVTNYSYYRMKKGEQLQAKVEVAEDSLEGTYGYGKAWTTSDDSVIKVDANGTLVAVGAGRAMLTLTVTCVDGTKITDEIEICVEEDLVSNITLNKTSLELFKKDFETITATVAPTNAANKTVTWSSSNTSVATVDANGKVTAVGVGTATITATAADGSGVSASCSVTVKPILASTIILDKTSLELMNGNSEVLTATVAPTNAENKAVTWTTSNKNVATVDANGKVTAVGVGTATITATAKDGSGVSASCTVTVKQKYPNGLNQYTDGKLYYFKADKIDTTYNGLADYKGDTWYVKNGAVDTSANGLKQVGSNWYLFKAGKVNRITTLELYAGTWWYVENGQVNFGYDGVADYSGKTWYIENGQVDFSKNGLLNRGDWYFFKNGQVDTSYTGLTNSAYGWWYINKGEMNFDFTGLTQYGGSWWYVSGSHLTFDYDGVAEYGGNLWYLENSQVDFGKNGLLNRGNWYYFKGGKVDTSYTGLTNSAYGWWYIDKGEMNFDYTGLTQYAGSWWYVSGSHLTFDYDGVAEYGGNLWYLENSQVDFGKNGLLNRGDWYYFKNGAVDRKFTGLTQYGGGWWYVEKGALEFDFTDLVYYGGSWWYVQNSTITFKYDGVVDFSGATWYLEDSKVDFGKSGLQLRAGTWYLFDGGKVNRTTTLSYYGGTWWYVEDGEVDFSANTIASYNNALWYIKDGKVDFGYTGTYTDAEGETYKVVNGVATLVD